MKKEKNNLIIGINLGDFGSSGGIMRNALEYANEYGDYDYLVIVPKAKEKSNTYGYMDHNLNFFQRVLFFKILRIPLHRPDGFYEYHYTKRIINKIKEESKRYSNTIVNLHNIHMAYIDIRILFKFLAKSKYIKHVFYTLHDAWPFTGGCYTFNYTKCDKWNINNDMCVNCCFQGKSFDNKHFSPKKIYKLKKKYTLLMKNKLTLIPVSKWLNEKLKYSFLKDIESIVNHGECMFKNDDEEKFFALKANDQKIVLSVSSSWYESKGAKYIYEVASKLPKDYRIVVIGGHFNSNGFDNILSISKVDNSVLPLFFSFSDVFLSVSQDESLGLTPCEAQLFGVPVVTFGHGGLKETIIDGKSGIIVGEDNDTDKMVKAIIHVAEDKPFNKEDIIASGNRFKKYEHAKRMLQIYNNCIKGLNGDND